MKLQKLVYYAQAWSLVWDGEPLYNEEIKAWANGPVVPALYGAQKGKFKVNSSTFNKRGKSKNLTESEKETIDSILHVYGDKPPAWLSELTHNENPWKEARKGLGLGERGNKIISLSSMAEYYESLLE